MKRIKKWWIALLLGALLMGIVVGVVRARPQASPAYKVTIPGAHFTPISEHYDFFKLHYLTANSGTGYFTAAVPIARPGRYTVERLYMWADDTAASNICATLYRVNPYTYEQSSMAMVCTSGSSGRQTVDTANISPDTIYGGHGAYLYVSIPHDVGLDFYAVVIEYH